MTGFNNQTHKIPQNLTELTPMSQEEPALTHLWVWGMGNFEDTIERDSRSLGEIL